MENLQGILGFSGDFGVLAERRPPVKKKNQHILFNMEQTLANVDEGINLLVNLIQILSSCFQSEQKHCFFSCEKPRQNAERQNAERQNAFGSAAENS